MSNSNMSALFGTPLWSFRDEGYQALNEHLKEAIANEKKIDAGVKVSNNGGWQSHGKLHMNPEFLDLRKLVKSKLEVIGKEYGFGAGSANLAVTSMWANINPPGSSNAIHSHQSPSGMPNPLVLSGAYYIKVPPNSGQFLIEDFYRPLRYLVLPFQEPNHINSFTIRVPPQEGSLLIFPAWMEHGVEMNESDEDRISIAFNIAFLTNRAAQPKSA